MDTYQPYVTSQGNVVPYTPQGITPASVEQTNPTLIAKQNYSMPTNLLGSINLPGYGGAPGFSFDFNAAQQQMYEKLKPFYEKIIEFSKGDLNLAKRTLEYTYQSGMREASTEADMQRRQMGLQFPQEQRQLQTDQNRRGILTSGFGGTQRQELLSSQNIRREAVDRALAQRQEGLTAQRGFGMEQAQRGFQKGLFDTEREQRNEAQQGAMSQYGLKQAEYQAQLGKKLFEENQRIASLSGGGGGSGGSWGSGPEAWDAQWNALHRNEGPRPSGYHGE